MLETTVSLVIFECNVKYEFKYNGAEYIIISKFDESVWIKVKEKDLYPTMEEISNLSYVEFLEYESTRRIDND